MSRRTVAYIAGFWVGNIVARIPLENWPLWVGIIVAGAVIYTILDAIYERTES